MVITLSLLVVLNDRETWSCLDDHCFILGMRDVPDDTDLPETAAVKFRLTDPTDLRNLADLIESQNPNTEE